MSVWNSEHAYWLIPGSFSFILCIIAHLYTLYDVHNDTDSGLEPYNHEWIVYLHEYLYPSPALGRPLVKYNGT